MLNFPTNSKGKELTMRCTFEGNERILKYKGGLFKKEILNRIDSKWETWCVKNENYVVFIEVNDEGGVCKQRKLPVKSEDGTTIYCDIDYMVDFKFKKRTQKYSCSDGSGRNTNWSCFLLK